MKSLLLFRKSCQAFLREVCEQIKKRFRFKEEGIILKELNLLNPVAIKNRLYPSIIPLYNHFSFYFTSDDMANLDREYRELRNLDFSEINVNDFQAFWTQILDRKLGNGSLKFPTLKKLIEIVLCLPHSGASAERAFSAINLNKTKIRNRLENDTLSGIMHSKSLTKGKNCYEFMPNKDCLKLHNIEMY